MAGYLLGNIAKPKKRELGAKPPNPTFEVDKAASCLSLLKNAFTVSQYSGDLGPEGSLKYTSSIPPWRQPPLRTALPQGKLKKAESALTPAGRLQETQSVGLPKTTAPPGPSISAISKPVGYGKPLPGTTKFATVKTALIERLIRLGATPIKGTPKLLMKERSPAELKALQETVEGAWEKNVTGPTMKLLSPLVARAPGKVRPFANKAARLVAEDPVGTILANAVPIPGAHPGYVAAKKGLERVIDRLAPA